MKKLVIIGLLTLACSHTQAQTHTKTVKTESKVKKEVKQDANAVGNKTAEIASKTASTVADQRHKTKVGPGGETIYINGEGKYYYVDKKGKHVFVTQYELKDKK